MQSVCKIVFIPGNGGGNPKTDNWFPYLKKKLEECGLHVVASEFPDNQLARESYWVPFLRDDLGVDDNTILVGHSSGALAALRFAEQYRILGSVIVGAYHTDLGMVSEKQSGYFNRPWNWAEIALHQKWIVQFASTDDPWIPIAEARFIHDKLHTEYYEFDNQGHFGGDYKKTEFPELFEIIKVKGMLDRER